jgi:hypothetical protein
VRHPSVFATGIAIACIGVLLVLEDGRDLDLGFAYLGPALIAALGVVLIASGRARRRGSG